MSVAARSADAPSRLAYAVLRAMAPHARAERALSAGLDMLVRRERLAGGSVYLLDRGSDRLRLAASAGFSRRLAGVLAEVPLRSPLHAGMAAVRAALENRPVAFSLEASRRAKGIPSALRGLYGVTAAVPMAQGGDVLGVLVAGTRPGVGESLGQDPGLHLVAQHMAEVAARGRLLDEAEDRARVSSAFAAVAGLAARGAPLRRLLEIATAACIDYVRGSFGAVILYDRGTDLMRVTADVGFPSWIRRRLRRRRGFRLPNGAPGIAARTGRSVVVQGRPGERDPGSGNPAWYLRALRVRSYASLPIRAHGETFGTLNIVSGREGAFPLRVVRTLEAMAAQLGMAVRLTRLRDDLKQDAARLTSERDRTRRLSEGLPAGLVLVAEDATIADANGWFARAVGVARPLIAGRKLTEYLHASGGGPDACRVLLRGAFSGTARECDAFLQGAQKEKGSVRVRLFPDSSRRDADGRPLVLVVLEDLTPSIEAARARHRVRAHAGAVRKLAQWVSPTTRVDTAARLLVGLWNETSGSDFAAAWVVDAAGGSARPVAVEHRGGRAAKLPGLLMLDANFRAQRRPWSVHVPPRPSAFGRDRRSDFATVVWVPLHGPEGLLGLVQLGWKEARPIGAPDLDRFTLLALTTAGTLRAANQAEELTRQSRKLREMTQALLAAQEQERRRIAADLHDQIGNALTGLRLNLQLIQRELPSAWRAEATRCGELAGVADRTLHEVRRIIQDLRPSLLDNLGLTPALRTLARDFGRRTGLDVRLRFDRLDLRLQPESETALFRAVQEGLTNAARHAGAGRVDVTLARRNGWVTASVVDNGRGLRGRRRGALDPAATGLAALQERVAAIGGSAELSPTRHGARLFTRIPLRLAT